MYGSKLLSKGKFDVRAAHREHNRTMAAQPRRKGAHEALTQIEELTKNMRRLKPYRKRAPAGLSPMPALSGAAASSALGGLMSRTIERDVGNSEKKIEKI